jgi:hypothetical protein
VRELGPASIRWREIECSAAKKDEGTPLCEDSPVFVRELLEKSDRGGLLYDSFLSIRLYLRP